MKYKKIIIILACVFGGIFVLGIALGSLAYAYRNSLFRGGAPITITLRDPSFIEATPYIDPLPSSFQICLPRHWTVDTRRTIPGNLAAKSPTFDMAGTTPFCSNIGIRTVQSRLPLSLWTRININDLSKVYPDITFTQDAPTTINGHDAQSILCSVTTKKGFPMQLHQVFVQGPGDTIYMLTVVTAPSAWSREEPRIESSISTFMFR